MQTELTAPEGRNTIAAPPLVLDGVVFSPDCGWQVALNATGMRIPIFQRKALTFAAGVIIVRSSDPPPHPPTHPPPPTPQPARWC